MIAGVSSFLSARATACLRPTVRLANLLSSLFARFTSAPFTPCYVDRRVSFLHSRLYYSPIYDPMYATKLRVVSGSGTREPDSVSAYIHWRSWKSGHLLVAWNVIIASKVRTCGNDPEYVVEIKKKKNNESKLVYRKKLVHSR